MPAGGSRSGKIRGGASTSREKLQMLLHFIEKVEIKKKRLRSVNRHEISEAQPKGTISNHPIRRMTQGKVHRRISKVDNTKEKIPIRNNDTEKNQEEMYE